MATTQTITARHLQIQLQVGTTSQGRPKLKNVNYANVNATASDDDILAVGQALAVLFGDTVSQIQRIDQVALSAASQAPAIRV